MLKHKQSAIAIAIGTLLAGCGGGDIQGQSAAVSQSRSSAQLVVAAPLEDSSRIAAGVDFSAALHADGTVFAWGSNTFGQLGQPGYGMSTTPVPVAGISGVRAIAAGGYHATAVLQNGTVWAWGNNSYGQLGNGGLSIGRLCAQPGGDQ
jgi:alpha-tubulin suppressor-like RCC1 family protein